MPELPKKKSGSISRIIIKCLWIFFCVGIVSITLLFFFIAKGFIGYMPPIEELQNPKDKFASEIYSSDMEVIGRYYQSKGNRVYVGYNEISPYLVNALIATEDARFEDHSGIDVKALARAVIKEVCFFKKVQGGEYNFSAVSQAVVFSKCRKCNGTAFSKADRMGNCRSVRTFLYKRGNCKYVLK